MPLKPQQIDSPKKNTDAARERDDALKRAYMRVIGPEGKRNESQRLVAEDILTRISHPVHGPTEFDRGCLEGARRLAIRIQHYANGGELPLYHGEMKHGEEE